MNKELKYLVLFSLLTLFGCGNEEDAVSGLVPPQSGETLQLTVSAADFVTDGAPDTRATDSGNETTFEDGDRVGIIILDADNNPIYDNIPYKYVSSNNTWVFDSSAGKSGCYYDPESTTYIVYYPYSGAADGVKGVDDLKAKFAPKFNQSNIEDYRASDLMVWSSNTHLPSSEKVLNAELKHAFASIYLTPKVGNYVLEDNTPYSGSYTPDISDVSLTIDNAVYIPFHTTDGTLRCIIPAGIAPGAIRCFYTIGSKTYGNVINISGTGKVAANTRYACQPEIKDVTYSSGNAHVGDFYCRRSDNNEGYLIPGDVVLTDEQKATCVGIVMKLGKDDTGDWKDDCQYKFKDGISPMNTIHGYVLALYDANDGKTCSWGSSGTEVNTNKEKTTGFYGYKNTQTVINYCKNNEGNLQNNFPATYFATEHYENIYSAPINSSGWFLPSAGQCHYWSNISRLTLLTQVKHATGNNSYNWRAWYWSSSEYSANHAWYLHFLGSYLGNVSKDNYFYVRSCLAF